MSGKKPNPRDERRARLLEIQAEQKRKEKRRARLIYLAVTATVLALVIPTVFVIVNADRDRKAREAAEQRPIEGVEEYEVAAANHVETDVEYAQTPPVGGDHSATWQNCGAYPQPVADENGVHSLEHGAVWITYVPEIPQEQIDALAERASSEPYLLISPRENLPAPIVASAWGRQLQVDSPDDPRLETFIGKYIQGEETPEPGAPCTGGIGL